MKIIRNFCFSLPLSLTVLVAAADAAVLVETRVGKQDVRIVSDATLNRVRIEGPGGAQLVDLDSRTVYLFGPEGQTQKVRLAVTGAAAPAPDFIVEKLGPGPRIAGHATMRFRVRAGDKVCAEIAANLLLGEKLGPVMAAFELLDQLNGALKGDNRSDCERVPFRRYRRIGWGLSVTDVNAPRIETIAVTFDFEPAPDTLTPPMHAEDVTDIIMAGLAIPVAQAAIRSKQRVIPRVRLNRSLQMPPYPKEPVDTDDLNKPAGSL